MPFVLEKGNDGRDEYFFDETLSAEKSEGGSMTGTACRHRWRQTHFRGGYLVTEGCFHCRLRISTFSEEPVPVIDDYREGDHFWSYLGSAQASRFDFHCEICGQEIPLPDMMALMLCLKCNPACGVFQAGQEDKDHKIWVYVALCANTSHSPGLCVGAEGIRALNEYFNQDLHDSSKKIVVVPCEMRQSVDTCEGLVLADVGLTELY
jgi:hypothetical protein